MSNVKNYAEQGGDKWIVGDVLEIKDGGEIKIDGTQLTRADSQSDSTAADIAGLKDDFNALLTKLKNAGLMS
ncbi:head fiber protein [Clostridium tyrobutyricum]|uniref:head fiber protein n=1 Tax=Clostridium tyrobutyricum TaxID=1519 RepID=UPI002011675B|nr:head fiber protein [Clostridium tyrobutyricum]MBR9648599.1 Head fiber protein [Clostridium tyrobutyricum]